VLEIFRRGKTVYHEAPGELGFFTLDPFVEQSREAHTTLAAITVKPVKSATDLESPREARRDLKSLHWARVGTDINGDGQPELVIESSFWRNPGWCGNGQPVGTGSMWP
jgi:hypothetical protein